MGEEAESVAGILGVAALDWLGCRVCTEWDVTDVTVVC